MKKIYLIFLEIKEFIMVKSFLAILLLGVTASLFSFNLMYGNSKAIIESFYNFSEFNTFTIKFDTEVNAEERNSLNIVLEDDKLRTALLMTLDDRKNPIVGWKGENKSRWFTQVEGNHFSKEDYQYAKNVVIIPETLYPMPDIDYDNYPFYIDGESFEIIGLSGIYSIQMLFAGCDQLDEFYTRSSDESIYYNHDNNENSKTEDFSRNTHVIPYSTYLKSNYIPNVIRLEYTVTSLKSRNNILSYLEEFFPNRIVIPPKITDYAFTEDMKKKLLQVAVIALISLINIIALFNYWIKIHKNTYRIYSIVGGRKKDILLIILTEWLILVLVAFALSRLFIILFSKVLVFLTISINFKLQEALVIVIICYIFSLLFIIPKLLKEVNSI